MSFKHEFEIEKVMVLLTESTDRIVVLFDGSSTYPDFIRDQTPSFTIDTAGGHGVEYAKKLFGVDPVVIDTLRGRSRT